MCCTNIHKNTSLAFTNELLKSFLEETEKIKPGLANAGWYVDDSTRGGFLPKEYLECASRVKPYPFRVTETNNFRGSLLPPKDALPEDTNRIFYTYGD